MVIILILKANTKVLLCSVMILFISKWEVSNLVHRGIWIFTSKFNITVTDEQFFLFAIHLVYSFS